jgi:hypothetical protein
VEPASPSATYPSPVGPGIAKRRSLPAQRIGLQEIRCGRQLAPELPPVDTTIPAGKPDLLAIPFSDSASSELSSQT